VKKRKPTLSPFAQLQRQADARRGNIPALTALYNAMGEKRAAYRLNPTPKSYLDMLLASQAYWSAVKATPDYPKGAEPEDE
jgi:hypothetical protein